MILFFNDRFNASVSINGYLYVEVDHKGTTLTPEEAREFFRALEEKAKEYIFSTSENNDKI
jgi:hypothetical protein